MRNHSWFDVGAALRGLRWPTVAVAGVEAGLLAFLRLSEPGLFSGAAAEGFVIALVRLTVTVLPATLAAHLVYAAWRAGRRQHLAPSAVEAIEPSSRSAEATKVVGELALVLRPAGSVLVLPGSLGASFGPAQLVVRLQPGDVYAGVTYDVWREHLYEEGTARQLERLHGRAALGPSESGDQAG